MTPLAHAGTGTLAVAPTALLLATAAGLAGCYVVGARGLAQSPGWRGRRAAFCLGLLVAAGTLLPTVDDAAERTFALHMTQHMTLLLVAAPLLALGAPGLPLLLVLPLRWRRRVAAVRGSAPGRRIRSAVLLPVAALLLQTGVLWFWHLPAAYASALANPVVHATEHLSLLAVAWAFWAVLVTPARSRLRGALAVGYVFVTALPMAALGAFLTFAPSPLYPEQTGTGPGALGDQQLAGLVMWVPAEVVYLVVCAALVLREMRGMERERPDDAPLPSRFLPTTGEVTA